MQRPCACCVLCGNLIYSGSTIMMSNVLISSVLARIGGSYEAGKQSTKTSTAVIEDTPLRVRVEHTDARVGGDARLEVLRELIHTPEAGHDGQSLSDAHPTHPSIIRSKYTTSLGQHMCKLHCIYSG